MPLPDRKIPIITGINDVPSSTGQSTHPNDSLLCANYNGLIDDLPNEIIARARQAISVTGDNISYNNKTGQITLSPLTIELSEIEENITDLQQETDAINININNINDNIIDISKHVINVNFPILNSINNKNTHFAIQEIPIIYWKYNDNPVSWSYPRIDVFSKQKKYIKLTRGDVIPTNVRPMGLKFKNYTSLGMADIQLLISDFGRTYNIPEFGLISIEHNGIIDFNIGLNPSLLPQLEGLKFDLLVYSNVFDTFGQNELLVTLLQLYIQSFIFPLIDDRVIVEDVGSAPAYGRIMPSSWDMSWQGGHGGSKPGGSGSGGSGS